MDLAKIITDELTTPSHTQTLIEATAQLAEKFLPSSFMVQLAPLCTNPLLTMGIPVAHEQRVAATETAERLQAAYDTRARYEAATGATIAALVQHDSMARLKNHIAAMSVYNPVDRYMDKVHLTAYDSLEKYLTKVNDDAYFQMEKYSTRVNDAASLLGEKVRQFSDFATTQYESVAAPSYELFVPEFEPDLSSPSEMFKTLRRGIAQFETDLDEDSEVGIQLVNTGGLQYYLKHMHFTGGPILQIQCRDEADNQIQLFVNIEHVAIALLKLPRQEPESPKRPIGFYEDGA